MSFVQNIPGFINQVEPPPVLPVSLVKTEVIKNEPPESEIGDDNLGSSVLDEESIVDIKNIEIVLHPLCEDSIKYETVSTNILETKHSEDFVKTENAPFVKIDNITDSETLIKTEDTSNGDGQEVQAQFNCNHCNRSYRYMVSLKRHQKYECQKEPQFSCQYCPYKAKHNCNLLKHLAIKHILNN